MSHRNVTGIFPSRKTDAQPRFESTLEGDFLSLLEFCPEVSHFEVQPVEVQWEDSTGKSRRYTPDVLVHFWEAVGRPPNLVEVKYRSELREKWPELADKFAAASRFAGERGWVFRLASDGHIRTERLKNARFLIPYIFRGPDRQEHLEELDQGLHRLGRASVRELLDSLRKDPWQKADLIPTLWFMLGTFQVAYNVDQRVTMSTTLFDVPEKDWSDSEIDRWNYVVRRKAFSWANEATHG